jgi:hypothetical protein
VRVAGEALPETLPPPTTTDEAVLEPVPQPERESTEQIFC